MRPVVYIVALVLALGIAAWVTVMSDPAPAEDRDSRRVSAHMERYGRNAAERAATTGEIPEPPVPPVNPAAPKRVRPKRPPHFAPIAYDGDLPDVARAAVDGGMLGVEGTSTLVPPEPPPAPPGWEPPPDEESDDAPPEIPVDDGAGAAAEGETGLQVYRTHREGLQLAFADVSDSVLACYGPWSQGDTGGDGRVLIKFLVTAEPGAATAGVEDVRIVDSVGHDPELDGCILEAVRALRFEAPPQERVRLAYPLQLSARRPPEDGE